MEVYYKYSKYFGIENLKNLHLRISLPSTLNDPFEGELNSDVSEYLLKNITATEFGLESLIPSLPQEKLDEIIRLNIILKPKLIGVISLSETPRNLIMWAHYANEHNGICIGLKKNFLSENLKEIDGEDKITIPTPLKVNYDSIRPQYNEDSSEFVQEADNQTLSHLLTKSNDWMYEKEHRCLISPEQADIVKILSGDVKKSLLNFLVNSNALTEIDNDVYTGRGIKSLYLNHHEDRNVAFLKKIKTSSIESIYMGCRLPQSDKEKIISEVKMINSPLGHIKLYACSTSRNRFELDMERIN
ncbi:DUF2971 domain-containing protein [Aeromonas jandaei]|uniref:DUF2971 domain-containing protein n=1 Tax=Aeromonas jandaei TaxID=650 RepID=UPI00191D3066|nr:DUF2971 domain-containing protein [Aeromonas jandaei]MBL0597279.1 DUF2971 domain-containing protein [Aeromonas jandaei]